ncbi:MAG: CIA30 family protein [Saprospiraceae bacterium]|nr:CIA30 family protein [Saprospiraceae bacterium]
MTSTHSKDPIDVITQTIWPLPKPEDTRSWNIVDDRVMGGLSSGEFYLNAQGHGIFTGHVSLENNGGFTSVRLDTGPVSLADKSKIRISIKGDGKKYQLRIKSSSDQPHAFIQIFQTLSDWQNLEFNLSDFYPTFRGRRLDIPNFSDGTLEEIAFLIANKKAEKFTLEIAEMQLVGSPN